MSQPSSAENTQEHWGPRVSPFGGFYHNTEIHMLYISIHKLQELTMPFDFDCGSFTILCLAYCELFANCLNCACFDLPCRFGFVGCVLIKATLHLHLPKRLCPVHNATTYSQIMLLLFFWFSASKATEKADNSSSPEFNQSLCNS